MPVCAINQGSKPKLQEGDNYMKNTLRQEDARREESPSTSSLAFNKASLARAQSNSEQKYILTRLQGQLNEHITEMSRRKMGCSRLDEGLRRLIEAGTTKCMDGDANAFGRRLIAGENLEIILPEARKGRENFYAQSKMALSPFDRDDVDVLSALDDERAAVMILEAAVQIQRRNISEARRNSMAQFAPAIADARRALARQILEGLSLCKKAAEQDRRLTEGLEPEEVALLRPQPLSAGILSQEAERWLFVAAGENLITQEEISEHAL